MVLQNGQFMNLMIVDDNAGMRELLHRMYGAKFESVIECSSGEECLQQFPMSPTDWVFMDINMSGLNGIRTTRELKQLFPGVKVVIVTRYDDQDLRSAAKEAGACGYVLKTNLMDLHKVLETASSFL
jgi:DNA-binding NarL/FixJ family response regulator